VSGSSRTQSTKCPHCLQIIYFQNFDPREPRCPFCETSLYFEKVNGWRPRVMTVAIVSLLGAVTWTPHSGGVWLLWMVVAVLPIFIASSIFLVESRLTTHRPVRRIPYSAFYALTLIGAFGEIYLLFGSLAVIFGTRGDLLEQMQMLSMPSSLISSRFLIGPNVTFFDMIGIVAANSFFWSFLLFLCFRTVRYFMARSRVQTIGISGVETDPKEDD
jgi:uncharacterized protein (DUF983 family)